jgi:glycosyltransferase involved in cell wall biosynthesis
MNILFLMIVYPDVKVNSSMYTDLAREFSLAGHNVYVAVADGPKTTSFTIEGDIYVLRVKTPELFQTTFIKKGLATLFLPFQIEKALNKYLQNILFDFIIIPTPPITFLSTVKKLKMKSNPEVYLILRDIFPQNAIDIGILRNPLLKAYFRNKEKRLYAISDHIGCMSQGNISYIKKHNPELKPDKLHLLPNWKSVTEYSSPDSTLKSKYGIDSKFIALYGGNLGRPQQIDFIFELAKETSHLHDVMFLLIGEGTEKARLIELVKKNNLKNVIIEDSLPRDKYQELVKICDVGLVNLNCKFTIPNIPSRTLSYWEAKIPVLASIDQHTDFSSIIDESVSGLWSITGDIKTYLKNFEMLYHNKQLRRTMGENGYKYLLENCTTKHAYSIISNKLFS